VRSTILRDWTISLERGAHGRAGYKTEEYSGS
jgi:hypothetical protein